MNRRGFLQACLATATAPYVVTSAGVLMPVRKIQTLPFSLVRQMQPYQRDLNRLVEWSLNGHQWTEDESALLKDNPAPPYVFHRRLVSRDELSLLYPIEVEQLGA